MIQRYDWDWLKRADGIGVLYADHLAVQQGGAANI